VSFWSVFVLGFSVTMIGCGIWMVVMARSIKKALRRNRQALEHELGMMGAKHREIASRTPFPGMIEKEEET
jgi:hypothetical protein